MTDNQEPQVREIEEFIYASVQCLHCEDRQIGDDAEFLAHYLYKEGWRTVDDGDALLCPQCLKKWNKGKPSV